MYTKSYSMLTALKKIDSHQLSILKHHLNSLILVTKAIGSISRLDELLERILHYTLTVTGAERGFLFLYNQKKEGLILEVMHGVNEKPPGEVFSFETYRVSQEIIKVVENTGKALIISQEDSNVTQGFRELNLYGIKQVLCVPFEVRDKRIGFLYLDHSIDGVMFREEELKLIESFATLTSLSIDNAYLKRKIEKRELNNISVTITTIPTMPDLTIIILKGILDDITMKETDKKIMPFIET
jgi:GAF domain-containing protein